MALQKVAAFVLVILCVVSVSAGRVLNEDRRLLMPVLQRGPVPRSGLNPCSFIPGQSRGRCTLSDVEDVAGGAASAFPGVNAGGGFAAASMANQTTGKQDSSSSS